VKSAKKNHEIDYILLPQVGGGSLVFRFIFH